MTVQVPYWLPQLRNSLDLFLLHDTHVIIASLLGSLASWGWAFIFLTTEWKNTVPSKSCQFYNYRKMMSIGTYKITHCLTF